MSILDVLLLAKPDGTDVTTPPDAAEAPPAEPAIEAARAELHALIAKAEAEAERMLGGRAATLLRHLAALRAAL